MGWATSSVDELGNQTFRKVRGGLGIILRDPDAV
jgi:hypothetical protein